MKHIHKKSTFTTYITLLKAIALSVYLLCSNLQGTNANPAYEKTLQSPDGKTFLTFTLSEGRASYSAGYNDPKDNAVVLIEKSPLGLVTDCGDYTENLSYITDRTEQININYNLKHSKTSQVDKTATHYIVTLTNQSGHNIKIEFVIQTDNIAFRYNLSRAGETGSVRVMTENTGFTLPEGTTTFLSPQSDPMIGWKRTKPSYEEEYTIEAPITTPSRYGRGYTFPCLYHVNPHGWVLISETGVDSRYCASRLSEPQGNTYKIAFPMHEENNGNGTPEPAFSLPGNTPWRTITLAPTLGPIVETTIPWDVVRPRYESQNNYTGGRGTWSWILWQDESINYDDQIKYIDLAAALGYQYTLIDCYWDKNIGRERMEKLNRYAKEQGVNLILWYSSSGYWNDIDQSPTDIMSDPIARKTEMQWLQRLGVAGIKVDFFGGDKQETMRLYEAILSDADYYGLRVIFHGCTLPRGWERMFPNYVGSEAVLASENLIFNQHFCDVEAVNATLHPFIRNTVGSMEFGGTFLNRRLNRGNDGGTTRKTTDAFQLATAVLFQNCIQNFALAPNNLDDAPEKCIEFMKQVPTEWDEVRYIDGYPGRYIVLARRAGEKWYIAAVNAQKETLEISVRLPMMEGTQATLLTDGKDGTIVQKETKIGNGKPITLKIAPQGGVVLTAKTL